MLLVTNRRPVVPLPLAHEGAVEPREVADRFFVREVAEALGERREAGLAADEDGRPDHEAGHYEDALTVREADLSMLRRISAPAQDPDTTLDSTREAVTILEDVAPTARRVFGGAHPLTNDIEGDLRELRAALVARETQSSGSA